jgi:hypothetical protein
MWPGSYLRGSQSGDLSCFLSDGQFPYAKDLPPPLGPREDPFCTVHARTKKVSTTAALSHANGRLNPHQKGAPSSIPATETTIPEGRGHSSRTPPTTWTTQAARKPASSGTVVGTPIRSKGPLPYVGFPKVGRRPAPHPHQTHRYPVGAARTSADGAWELPTETRQQFLEASLLNSSGCPRELFLKIRMSDGDQTAAALRQGLAFKLGGTEFGDDHIHVTARGGDRP